MNDEEYIILRATLSNGEIKTALVHLDTFRELPEPSAYFVRPIAAEEAGSVQIMGDTHLLDDSYTSD